MKSENQFLLFLLLGTVLVISILIILLNPSSPRSRELTNIIKPGPTEFVPPKNWVFYTNPTYDYSIRYPSEYKFQPQTDKQISQLGRDNNICLVITNKCEIVFTVYDNYELYDNVSAAVVAERLVLDSGIAYTINPLIIGNYDAAEVNSNSPGSQKIVVIKHPNLNRFVEIYSPPSQIFDQIISTFTFLGLNTNSPTCIPRPSCLDDTPRCMIPETEDMCPPTPAGGKFCGGIAGIRCPEGYTCKYDGNYPDAGGTCVQEKFTCPVNGWVDCMPGPGADKLRCSEDAINWYKSNCPNFEGVAY